jgi:hypothetical protein
MSYVRFGLMILTSTLVMFVLMYLNTYALEHVFFSETRVWMAVMMGAVMAAIMVLFMLGMYRDTRLNLLILGGAVIVFGVSLWLVRSQATVSGTSYLRAMIPHHSIAIMTSERARITDPRVRKLADEIVEAQQREIAEMRYLIAHAAAGPGAESLYQDPPVKAGTLADALSNTLISQLDLAPISADEADRVLPGSARCTFRRTAASDPILSFTEGGPAAIKLNGVLVALQPEADNRFSAPGAAVTVRMLGDQADGRQKSELVFTLDQGLRVGYSGFSACTG